MKKIKLIPAIYLYNGKVVDKSSKEIIGDGDAVALATNYGNYGADELLVFDISGTDEEHDANISTMIQIADNTDIPMIVGGNVKRLEDVKKYLYTGAKMAFFDLSNKNDSLIKESADRFGTEKIAAYIPSQINDVDPENLKSLGISLFITNQMINTDADVLLTNDIFDNDQIAEFAKNDLPYGISTSDMNIDFDFMTAKTELKCQGVDVDVFESKINFSDFKVNSDGMIPVIVQDYKTNDVLMLAYMNEESFDLTIKTGKMTYYSRSRDEIWVKGETSGHYQYVKELSMDCDFDTMLAKVHQIGVPCHTGAETCFFNELVKKDYRHHRRGHGDEGRRQQYRRRRERYAG